MLLPNDMDSLAGLLIRPEQGFGAMGKRYSTSFATGATGELDSLMKR